MLPDQSDSDETRCARCTHTLAQHAQTHAAVPCIVAWCGCEGFVSKARVADPAGWAACRG